MMSYFCDVISSPHLWRHIFVTSFLHQIYDVIFWWRHFLTGFMNLFPHLIYDVSVKRWQKLACGDFVFTSTDPPSVAFETELWRSMKNFTGPYRRWVWSQSLAVPGFDHNPLFQGILNFVRSAQQGFFVQVAHYTLHPTRSSRCFLLAMDALGNSDSTTYFLLDLPTISSCWTCWTIHIYHLSLGASRQSSSNVCSSRYHATLVHTRKDMRTNKFGLYRNVSIRENRIPCPK
jgi:hypothetical protein